MRILLDFVLVSLAVAPWYSSLPTKGDSIRSSINSITNIAQITLVHITKLRTKLPVAPHLVLITPSIEGLTSISRDLGLLENELQSPFTELFSQIQADVSSMEGRVRDLAMTVDCAIQPRPKGEATDHSFPDSHLYVTLTKVQLYLEYILLNMDKLKVC